MLLSGCVCRERLEGLIKRRHWTTRITQLASVDAILGCVEAGLGVALLPELLLRDHVISARPCGQLDLSIICRAEAEGLARSLVTTLQ